MRQKAHELILGLDPLSDRMQQNIRLAMVAGPVHVEDGLMQKGPSAMTIVFSSIKKAPCHLINYFRALSFWLL